MSKKIRFFVKGTPMITAAVLLAGLFFCSTALTAQNVNYALAETPGLGNLNSNDFNALAADDGTLEKIAEQKDASNNYRIEWTWRFNVVGTSELLKLEGQATNSKHGMDFYDFHYKRSADPEWTYLGTVSQTTMTQYSWPLVGVSGEVDIRATDTNKLSDSKRSNQLWMDHMSIHSTGEVSQPLGAPSDLSAQAQSETGIRLAWADNSTSETGFRVERKSTGDFLEIADLPTDTVEYLDTGLTPQTVYHYRVMAYAENANSEYSNEASAITQSTNGGGSGPDTDKIIAGYYPSWGIYNARKYWVRYIPFDRITHVNYAFANIDPSSLEVIIGDSFAEETNRKDPETANGLPAGNLHQLTHYRDFGHNGPAYNHLKIIISVGGWSWSENFSDVALTPTSRWRFAESLKDFILTYNLDGADLDWEYPTGDPNNCGEAGNVCRAEDPVNHALLIMACRAKLDELDPGLELSIAMPAGFGTIVRVMPPIVDNSLLTDTGGNPLVYMANPQTGEQFEVLMEPGAPTAVEMLDYVHIMNYDMVSASLQDTTRHHAPLYGYEGFSGDPAEDDPVKGYLTRFNSHHAIQAYRFVHDDYSSFDSDNPALDANGGIAEIPANKLTFGIPMYGRGFGSVDAGSWDGFEGLFQATSGNIRKRVPKGTWDGGKWGNTGVFGYWDILLNYGGDADDANNAIQRVAPPDTTRPYGPHVLTGSLYIGFDDRQSITEKINYALSHEMAGVMFWDFTGDLSEAQVDQGVAGAGSAYPEKSLIYHIADELEGSD